MANLQIRDVPEDIVTILKQASKSRGLSLQAFLLESLGGIARAEMGRSLRARWPIAVVNNPVDYESLINDERRGRDLRNIDRGKHAAEDRP